MSDSIYDDYYHQSLELQHHVEDIIDDHGHPQAHTLMNEMQQLTAAFKEQKNPRHMEDKIKTLEHGLLQVREQGEKVMSYQDIDNLQHRFRRLREQVRSMPHY